MTGRDLMKQLQQFGDLQVSDQEVIGWIDMAQKKASLDLPVARVITVSPVVVGTTTVVKTGVFNLISATCETGEYPLSAITVGYSTLTFSQAANTVTVKFTSISEDYTTLDGELTIHPALHAPLVYFLISMYYDKEGEGDSEESSLAERFYQRWVYYRNLAIAAISGTDNDLANRLPVETTDVLPRSSRRALVEAYYE